MAAALLHTDRAWLDRQDERGRRLTRTSIGPRCTFSLRIAWRTRRLLSCRSPAAGTCWPPCEATDAWTRRRRALSSTKGCVGSRTTPRCCWRWDRWRRRWREATRCGRAWRILRDPIEVLSRTAALQRRASRPAQARRGGHRRRAPGRRGPRGGARPPWAGAPSAGTQRGGAAGAGTCGSRGQCAGRCIWRSSSSGGCARTAGDLEGAVAAYRQAAVTSPGSQTANLALAHVLDQLGDRESALEALRKTLTRDRAEIVPDGWWAYLYGQAQDADALVEDLRQQAGS